ncbi:hypothetical protein, partial [Kistimonas scapharcae]|uniref:hypothetical protein n=1 Tax=Kistimonas scapharcae TaxID=1036133 RepID=UPI0031E60A0C
ERDCPESFDRQSRLKQHLVSKHKKEGALKRKVNSGLPTTFQPSAKRAKPALPAAAGSEEQLREMMQQQAESSSSSDQ